MNSQNKQIAQHLQSGKKITPLGALRLFNCLRLGARIYEIKKTGLDVKTTLVTRNNKTFAEYKLNQNETH